MARIEEGTLLQDRYRVAREVGGGGMGRVYLAHDTRLADKPCALKELLHDPHLTPEEQAQATAQFHREAAILAHLNHPNLPNVYDYFEERERFYLVMDFVEGETLEHRLGDAPRGIPPEQVIEWAVQLCDVLEYLHGQTPPVIFRDLKPSNIMITPQDEVKLIDFGVARLFDPSKGTDTLKMGTAGYAPPEQYAGQGQTTPRSDIFSLGVTLYELLTGDDPTAHPFVFSAPHTLNSAVSTSFSNVIMRAINMDPAERFSSAKEMKEALQKATQPRRLRLPSVQRQRGTGTRVMPSAAAAAVPFWQSRPLRILRRILTWTLRVIVPILIVALLLAVAIFVVGALLLSSIAESTIANAEWGWDSSQAELYIMTETDLRRGVESAIELYTLDAVSDVRADFRPPDHALVWLKLGDRPFSIEAQLGVENGAPMVVLERFNNIPLYVVGGIISGGINRGFQRAWEDSPPITRFEIEPTQITIEIDR